MNIVILHCHFERGGVTQVVNNHVRGLGQDGRVDRMMLVSGGRTSGLDNSIRNATLHAAVDDFDYDVLSDRSALPLGERASSIVSQLRNILCAAGFSASDSVLHWHNHSLGKNAAAPLVIATLAQEGWRQLLQIHDFAEDNRPANYRHLIEMAAVKSKSAMDAFLYPEAENVHYAVLTRADADVLRGLGTDPECVHWLPNSVALPASTMPPKDEAMEKIRSAMDLPATARWSIYPVRGIRRKNIGEWLLLSRWLPTSCYSGVTLRPTTNIERRSYLRWKLLACDVSPRAVFDAGHHADVTYADNLAAADVVLSTSVAEGFGMTFLEPWLADREVIARRLPTAAKDFEATGIELKKFYDEIRIPGTSDWIDQCMREIRDAMTRAWADVPASFRPSLNRECFSGDTIDFGRLTVARQIEVLRKIASEPNYERNVIQENAKLFEDLLSQPDREQIQANANIVRSKYSVESCTLRLMNAYQAAMHPRNAASADVESDRQSAVDRIEQVRPFFPCRTESFDDD